MRGVEDVLDAQEHRRGSQGALNGGVEHDVGVEPGFGVRIVLVAAQPLSADVRPIDRQSPAPVVVAGAEIRAQLGNQREVIAGPDFRGRQLGVGVGRPVGRPFVFLLEERGGQGGCALEGGPRVAQVAVQRHPRVRSQLAAEVDALSSGSIDVPEEAASGWRRHHVEDLVADLGPVASQFEAGCRGWRDSQAELPRIGRDGIEGRIGAELEGERAGILRIGAGKLEDDRRPEPVAVAPVDGQAGGQDVVDPQARGKLPKRVRTVVCGVEQVAEGDTDLIVANGGQERERLPRRPPRLGESAVVVLLRGDVCREAAVGGGLVGLGEDERLHVVAHVLETTQQREFRPGAVTELAGDARRPELRLAAGVCLGDVGVELLDLIAAVEPRGLQVEQSGDAS